MAWKKSSKTKEPGNFEKAYEYAVFLLSLRLRTIGEIQTKMRDRGYGEGIIEKTVAALTEQRYLDDRRFAEVFLDNLKKYKVFGYYSIKKKLLEKKLSLRLVEELLERDLPMAEELIIAKRFLKKEGYQVSPKSTDQGEVEYRSFGDNEDRSLKAKMAQKLKSRGFRGEVIAKLVF